MPYLCLVEWLEPDVQLLINHFDPLRFGSVWDLKTCPTPWWVPIASASCADQWADLSRADAPTLHQEFGPPVKSLEALNHAGGNKHSSCPFFYLVIRTTIDEKLELNDSHRADSFQFIKYYSKDKLNTRGYCTVHLYSSVLAFSHIHADPRPSKCCRSKTLKS